MRSGVPSPPTLFPASALLLLWLLTGLSACTSLTHYRDVEQSLLAGNPDQAVSIIDNAKDDYGQRSRLLYLMDRGMALHLAGRYHESNEALEAADHMIEDFYTTRVRDEIAAMLINEAQLPYVGDDHEQVMVNVLKALNYARMRNFEGALVEARKIDHRLNMIHDQAADDVVDDAYRDDPFARYLTGILYEAIGDTNNAFIAYRKAEQAYQTAQAWSQVVFPEQLGRDLLRVTKALRLTQEHRRYRERYRAGFVSDPNLDNLEGTGELVVISLHGRAPVKTDVFLDVPISLEALQLVALTRRGFGSGTRRSRAPDSILFGLRGDIARIALPQVRQARSSVAYSTVWAAAPDARAFQETTQRVHDVAAMAKKHLDDHYQTIVLRAVARTAMKMAAAAGIGYGARKAAKGDSAQWIGPLAQGVATMVAMATEEADIRSWRTLPRDIQMARLRVPAGEYEVSIQPAFATGRVREAALRSIRVSVEKGETVFLTHRVVE